MVKEEKYQSIACELLNKVPNLKEVERRSGVAYATLYDLKRGKTDVDNMKVDTFIRIAHALGMTADDLYYGVSENITDEDSTKQKVSDAYDNLNQEGKTRLAEQADLLLMRYLKEPLGG